MSLMTKTHARRLLKLAAKLDTVSKKEFDMESWWRKKFDAKGTPCGTAGCALGWAGTIPAFRKAGLRTNTSQDMVEFVPTLALDLRTCDTIYNECGYGHAAVHFGSHAGQRFFGLTEEEAVDLFTEGEGHRTPKQVAGNIRKLVKKHHPALEKADRKERLAAA